MKNLTQVISQSIFRIVTPLARVLLRHGVAFGSFSEWSRKAFIHAAEQELSMAGKKQTVSNISAMTGLTRKETKRLRELDVDSFSETDVKFNRATRVLSGWQNDPDFIDAQGEAKTLPLDAESAASFSSLVHRYSGDMTPIAMLDVLSAASCVAVSDGQVTMIKNSYVPSGDQNAPVKLTILGKDVSELIQTIQHNLTHSGASARYQRKVYNTALAPEHLDEFRLLAGQKSQELLETLHAYLIKHEVGETRTDGVYVALGIYLAEEESSSE